METTPCLLGSRIRRRHTGVRSCTADISWSDVLLIARPALHGVLPAAVCPKILTAHDALRKLPERVRARAVFSYWIRILGRNGSPVFALEPIPIFLGCSQHLFPHACSAVSGCGLGLAP